MANSTLNRNDNDSQKDQLNPGQSHYDREFNNIVGNAHKTTDGTEENANAERAKLREKEGGAGLIDAAAKSNAKQKEHEGSWTTNLAGKAAASAIPVKVPFFRRRRTGVIGGIIAAITTIGALIGIIVPNYAIVNLKEVAVNKFVEDQLATLEPRTGIIISKKISPNAPDVTDTCLIKVRCRFKGVSERGINKLRDAGFKIESSPMTGHPLKYHRMTTMTYNVGGQDVRITPQEFNRAMRMDPKFRNMIYQAYKPRSAALTDPLSRWVTNKLRIFRGNQMDGVKDKRTFRQVVRDVFRGNQAAPDGSRLKSTEGGAPGDASNAERQQQLGDVAKEVTEDAAKLSEAYDNPDTAIPSLPDTDGSQVTSISKDLPGAVAKGAIKGAILGPISTADSLCSIYYMIAAVGFGAKVIAAEQLIRFYYLFSNAADRIKAGDAATEEIRYLGEMLSSEDEQGRTFADSFGYQWMAYGSLGSTNETMKYKLGGGLTGDLINLKSEIDSFGGGKTCKFVTNPLVQGGAFLLYIFGTVLSGGTLSAVSIGANATVATAVAVAQTIMLPMLTRLVAGTLVTGDENGKDAGNAFTAGGGAFASMLGKTRAMVPMTKSQVRAYERESRETLAISKAAEKKGLNPFDISNPLTPAGGAFARIAPYAVSPFSESSIRGMAKTLNPISSFGMLFSSLSPKASAEHKNVLDICTDPDYQAVAGGLATDPFCNVRYGFDIVVLKASEFDPDPVTEYMLQKEYIDGDGVPKGKYQEFIADCLENQNPISQDGDEQYSLPKYCTNHMLESAPADLRKDQTMMRLFFIDTTIHQGMQEQMDGERQQVSASLSGINPEPAAATSGTSGTGGQAAGSGAPTGTPQELAQRILSSGKVTGFAAEMGQIKAYARGDFSCNIDTRILQIILKGTEKHSFFITSLNRACTGSKAGHSRDHHSRDGGGHAVDIDNVDGGGSTGGLAKDTAFLRDLLPAMPPRTEIGQINCRSGANVLVAPGMEQVRDDCTHIHIGVPG